MRSVSANQRPLLIICPLVAALVAGWVAPAIFGSSGGGGGLLLLGIVPLLAYIVGTVPCVQAAGRRASPLLAWAVIYAIGVQPAQVVYMLSTGIIAHSIRDIGPLEYAILVGVPTAITAALHGWVTRSWVVGLVSFALPALLLGQAAAAADSTRGVSGGDLGDLINQVGSPLHPVTIALWIACVSGPLAIWAWNAKPLIPPIPACSACSYPRTGLPAGTPCPECGRL